MGTGLADAIRRVLSSPGLVRWGAVTLVLVGALWLAGDASRLLVAYRASRDPYAYYVERPLAELFSILPWVPGWFMISFGLIGLYASLSGAGRLPRRLALVGAAVSLAAAVLFLQVVMHLWLSEVWYSQIPAVLFFGVPTGIVLSGVAAFWARGLGRWRFVAPFVCLLSVPPVSEVLPYLLLTPDVPSPMVSTVDFETEVLLASPRLLAGAGWILFGLVLFGAKGREAALLAKEREMLETENLALARRLYEGAWGKGDLSVVDELVAPDFFDHRRRRRGPEEFKRAIADLRRAFPDLRLSAEEQTAEGDTVTTRCALAGTDRGGVLWYPPTGKHATFSGTYTDRFSDGRLVEHRGEADTAGSLEQLGLPAVER